MAPFQAPSGGRQDATLAVSALVIVVAVISVALRFYTRTFTGIGLGSDDWLIMMAVILILVTAALLLWANSVDPNGLWVSDWNTDPDYVFTAQHVFYLKLSFLSSVLYFSIAGATKLGILLMYNRIFAISNKFRYQLYALSGLVIAWWVGCTVATLTSCIPLQWTWHSIADPSHCFDYNIFWMASGAGEIFLDVLILTLPIGVVMRMQLSRKQKITVLGIFLLGGFVIITGLVKVILGYRVGRRVPSYSNTEVWASVHAGMAIICSSLPIFRPLVSKIADLFFITKVSTLFSAHSGVTRISS